MNSSFDLDAALETLRGYPSLLICPHDDPDPDALAAAWAMSTLLRHELGCETTVAVSGIIGRAENRAMVRTLGIRLRRLAGLDPAAYDGVVLIDTQPPALNHSAPAALPVLVCVDHHPRISSTARVPWFDVRPDGECTASIVLEYLVRRDVALSPPLATALLYALKTDTRDLSRGASDRDLEAWAHVSPLADMRALGDIVNPTLEPRYYDELRLALEVARTAERVVVVSLGELPYPDLVAEIADLFVRRKGTDWCLCGGTYQGMLRFSLRTEEPAGHAGRLAQQLIHAAGGSAGGHGMIGGGRVPLTDGAESGQSDMQFASIAQELLARLGVDDDLVPMCDLRKRS